MGLFSHIFGASVVNGTHPDSARRTTERGEARNYIFTDWACPSCRKKGGKEVRGHASVGRRLHNGEVRFYDVYNVFCGCGRLSTFWSDSSSWAVDMVRAAESICNSKGHCVWITGSGQVPQMERGLFE